MKLFLVFNSVIIEVNEKDRRAFQTKVYDHAIFCVQSCHPNYHPDSAQHGFIMFSENCSITRMNFLI